MKRLKRTFLILGSVGILASSAAALAQKQKPPYSVPMIFGTIPDRPALRACGSEILGTGTLTAEKWRVTTACMSKYYAEHPDIAPVPLAQAPAPSMVCETYPPDKRGITTTVCR